MIHITFSRVSFRDLQPLNNRNICYFFLFYVKWLLAYNKNDYDNVKLCLII